MDFKDLKKIACMLMQREEILRPLCKPSFVKFGVGEANLLVILEAIKMPVIYRTS